MHYVELKHRCRAFRSMPLTTWHTIRVHADTSVSIGDNFDHDMGSVLLSKLRTMAAESVTDDEIRMLENQALEAGDDVLLGRCIGALQGNRRARIYVSAYIASAKRDAKSDFALLIKGRDVASLAAGLASAAFPTVLQATLLT